MSRRLRRSNLGRNAWFVRDRISGEILPFQPANSNTRIWWFDAERSNPTYSDPLITQAGPGGNWYGTAVTAGAVAIASPPNNPRTAASGVDFKPITLATAASNATQNAHVSLGTLASGGQLSVNNCPPIRLSQGGIFQARVAFSGATTPGTTESMAIGLVSTTNTLANWDAIAVSAWFRLNATADWKVGTDDNVTDSGEIDTGLDVSADGAHLYEIDFRDPTDVKFLIDNVRMVPTARFNMTGAATSSTDYCLAPTLMVGKTSAAGSSTALTFTISSLRVVVPNSPR